MGKAYISEFNALLGQSLSWRLRRVTGDTPDLEFLGELCILQDCADDRTALFSCRAEDCEGFGHFGQLISNTSR
jgi:hypothetical protein